MPVELTALAAAAATALVTAMAKEGWDTTRRGIVALWRRVRPGEGPAVEADLEAARAELVAARGHGAVHDDLVTEWRSRLRRLLAEHPELAGALSAELRLTGSGGPAGDTVTHHGTGHIVTIRGGVHGGFTLPPVR